MPERQYALPIGLTTVFYIVEEYEPEAMDGVHYAWCFEVEEDAREQLLSEMAKHGHNRAYKMYVLVTSLDTISSQ